MTLAETISWLELLDECHAERHIYRDFWSQITIAALLQWIDYYHSMEGLGWDRGDFSMEADAFRYP